MKFAVKFSIGALLVALLCGSVAFASSGTVRSALGVKDGVVTACVEQGHLKIAKCPDDARRISWNKQGERGPRGLQGPRGDKGEPGLAAFGTIGPFALTHDDSGSCPGPVGSDRGEIWADDEETRYFVIQPQADGTFDVIRYDVDGTFTAKVGAHNPNNCSAVFSQAVEGTFNGYMVLEVSGGVFNPDATCPDTCTNQQFVDAFFDGGEYEIAAYEFNYYACGGEHHWRDAGRPVSAIERSGNIADCA